MCIDSAESSTEQMSYPLEKAGHRIQGVRFVSVYESSRGSGLGDTGRWGQSRHRMPPEGPGCPSKVGGVITLPSSDRGREGEEKVRRPRGERSRENVCEGSHRNIQISTGQGAASLEETRAGDARKRNSEKGIPGKSGERRQSAKSSQPRMVVLESRKTRGRSGVQMEREDPSVWDRGRHHPDAVPVPGERVDLVFDPQRGKRQSRRNT